jgi:hypothetical protein
VTRWTEADLRARGLSLEPTQATAARPKYGNRRKIVNGIEFDSAKEAARYMELQFMRKAGLITDLRVHPVYEIVVCGALVCRVEPDFDYRQVEGGELVVEDVKSEPTKTPAYRLKRKLMKAVHGIEVREIT